MQLSEVLRKLLGFFIFCVVLFYSIIFIFAYFEEVNIESELETLNSTVIYPEESNEISSFLLGIENISDNSLKLQKISNFVQEDFVWFLNNKSFKCDDKYRSFLLDLLPVKCNMGHYYSDNSGKKVVRSGNFSSNPYFISYYKAEACGEHATLAYFLANKTGMTVRKVGDPSGYHAWLEIYSGEKWYFYDPTFNTSQSNISSWFNERNYCWNNSVIQNAGRIFYENEDITHYYPPYGLVNISGISSMDNLYITWVGGNQKYTYQIFNNDKNTVSINLTPKQYCLHLNWLLFFNSEIDIVIRPDEETNINLSEILGPTREYSLNNGFRDIASKFEKIFIDISNI